MDIAVLGIDLGKAVCSLAGVDGTGAVVMCKRVQRFRLLESLARLPPCVGAMEACGGAHHVCWRGKPSLRTTPRSRCWPPAQA